MCDFNKDVKVGDIIKFGRYPQGPNGEEKEIEWRVLDNTKGELFLLSEYSLDCKEYNEEIEDAIWETCTLRKWLNEDFYNKAFTSQEKAIIRTTKVTADKNPEFSTDQGNVTNDKVFILSIDEVEEYFKDDDSRIAKPTEYAKSNGAYENNKTGGAWWWLRSPDCDSNNAIVDQDGFAFFNYIYAYDLDFSVRVALKIHL